MHCLPDTVFIEGMEAGKKDDSAIDRSIREIDLAIESHMDWTRHLLRFCMLGEEPRPDMLQPTGHEACKFGRWLMANHGMLEEYDSQRARKLVAAHEELHASVRSLIASAKNRENPAEPLARFESSQASMLELLSHFRGRLSESRSYYDPLTGLPLRHFLEHSFLEFQKRTRRSRHRFYLAVIDVDHFKRINDRFGHNRGDDALVHLAQVLLHAFRENEPLYRIGGEEFLHFLEVSEEAEAVGAIERAMAVLRESPLPLTDSGFLNMSITVGLAEVSPLDALRDALERADAALYHGKRSGRNRWVMGTPPTRVPRLGE